MGFLFLSISFFSLGAMPAYKVVGELPSLLVALALVDEIKQLASLQF
jgi:hypothetical protein